MVEKERDPAAADRLDALWNCMFLDPVLKGEYPELLKEELNHWVQEGDLELIHAEPDFFGLNHYTVMRAQSESRAPLGISIMETPAGLPVTDSGWEIRPEGLLEQLLDFRERYGEIPVYLTENGCSCPDFPDSSGKVDDPERISYLRDCLEAGRRVLEQGVDLRGWFFWSLLDNFEWAEGYTKRFGLVYVNFETQERTPKQSFYFVQQVIGDNTVPDS